MSIRCIVSHMTIVTTGPMSHDILVLKPLDPGLIIGCHYVRFGTMIHVAPDELLAISGRVLVAVLLNENP